MVNNTDEHTRKTRAEQGAKAGAPKPIKIGASTPYDFQGSNMTAYGGLLPVTTMLEKLQFQQLIEEHVTIKRLTTSMPGCRFVLAMILALYVGFSRLNHLQFGGERVARAEHILAVPGIAASGSGAATAGGSAADAAARLASGPRGVERSYAGHRYHRADRLRTADGRTQGIQPETSWQEELSANPDVSGGDARVHRRRIAQRRTADWETDRRTSGERIRRAARNRGEMLRAGGLGVLLLGGGGSLREARVPVRAVGPEDAASGGAVASRALDRIAAHRCRRPVRFLVSTSGMGK